MISMTACGFDKYYDAIGAQNAIIHQINVDRKATERREDIQHQENMMLLMESAIASAAETDSETDDVMVPMMIMMLEDKRTMAKALTAQHKRNISLHEIKAPDTFGDGVKKSAGVLGIVAGAVVGIVVSNNVTDIAKSAIAGSGTHTTMNGNDNSTATADNGSSVVQDTTLSGEGSPLTLSTPTSSTDPIAMVTVTMPVEPEAVE